MWDSLAQKRIEFGSKHSVRIDCGFIDQHDRNVIFDGVDAVALPAFERLSLRGQWRFAGWTHENFEKVLVDHRHILLQESSGCLIVRVLSLPGLCQPAPMCPALPRRAFTCRRFAVSTGQIGVSVPNGWRPARVFHFAFAAVSKRFTVEFDHPEK